MKNIKDDRNDITGCKKANRPSVVKRDKTLISKKVTRKKKRISSLKIKKRKRKPSKKAKLAKGPNKFENLTNRSEDDFCKKDNQQYK